MREFHTECDAKEYLIERIIAKAKTEGVPLSEVERQMLYFTQTGRNFPNMMEVNAEFKRDYDSDEYEQKIAELARQIDKRNKIVGAEQQSDWDDAVVKLSEGDHYLLVLTSLGRSSPAQPLSKWLPAGNFYGTGKARPSGDFLRLIVVALALAFVMFAVVVIESWLKK